MESMVVPIPIPPAPDVAPAETAPSRKRQQVLQAAAELFIAQGYGAVSMDAVARAASVSKATLYAHFTSKDALFATIVGDACRRSPLDGGDLVADATGDVRAALHALGGRLLRFLLDPRTVAIARVAIAESGRFPELGAAFLANGPMAFQQRIAVWLAKLHQAGAINAPDAMVAANHLGALLRGSLHLEVLLKPDARPSEERVDETVEAAVAAFLRAYAPPPPLASA